MVVRPARAFGAPQTISFRPSTVSTWQTCSRSAFGWRSAETILATVKGAKAAMVGWLLAAAQVENVGVYAKSADAFFAELKGMVRLARGFTSRT